MTDNYVAEVVKIYNYQRQLNVFDLPLADVIGGLSFFVVLLTLYASLRAARESARANMLNSLPLITLDYDHSKDEVIIENFGKGLAVNVQVDKFYNWVADKHFHLYGLQKVVFKKIPILKHNEKIILPTIVKGSDPFGLAKFTIFSVNQAPLVFAIKFSDLSGKRFLMKVCIEKGTAAVSSSPKELNLATRMGLFAMRATEAGTMAKLFTKVQIKKIRDGRNK